MHWCNSSILQPRMVETRIFCRAARVRIFTEFFLQIHIFKESVRLQNNLCSLSKQNLKPQQGIILFATTISPVRVQANMNRMRNIQIFFYRTTFPVIVIFVVVIVVVDVIVAVVIFVVVIVVVDVVVIVAVVIVVVIVVVDVVIVVVALSQPFQ